MALLTPRLPGGFRAKVDALIPLDRRVVDGWPRKYLFPDEPLSHIRRVDSSATALIKLFFLALADGLTRVGHGLGDYEKPLANRRTNFGRVGKRTDQEIVDGKD